MTEELKNLSEFEELHKSYRSFVQMNRVLKQEFSDKIRDQLVSIYPEAKENLDQIFFSFVDVSGLILAPRLKKEPPVRQFSENGLVVSVNKLNPLEVESLFFMLQHDCKDKTFKFDNFVSFLKEFDPNTLINPPPKQYLHVLSKWFVENVDWKIEFKEEEKNGAKLRILTWGTVQRPKKYKKVVVPESTTLKEIASAILATGNLKNIKNPKSLDFERM